MTSNSCSAIQNLEAAVRGAAYGIVMTVGTNGAKRNFVPEMDSNAARVAALAAAITSVPQGGKVVLIAGSFILPQALTDYAAHTNWKIEFEQGAWLAYDDETLPGKNDRLPFVPGQAGDWQFFVGQERHARNHGIFPDTGEDMQQRIQAALFTMPAFPQALYLGDLHPSDAVRYADIKMRTGKLYLPHGELQISRTIYFSARQHIIGDESIVIIQQRPGFAPCATPNDPAALRAAEKFSIVAMRTVVGTANELFDMWVRNITLSAIAWVGNEAGSGLKMGGAQGSGLNNIYQSNIPYRGISFWDNSCYFSIGHLYLDGGGINLNKRGPLLELFGCQDFTIESMTIQFMNSTTVPGDRRLYNSPSDPAFVTPGFPVHTAVLPGALFNLCSNFKVGVVNGENIGAMLWFDRCSCFDVGPCGNHLNMPTGVGESMARLWECDCYSVGPFNSTHTNKTYEILGPSGALILDSPSNNEPTWRVPAVSDYSHFVNVAFSKDKQVLGHQQGAIPNSADPTTNAILAALRTHGIIAT